MMLMELPYYTVIISAPNLRARILRNQNIVRYNEIALDPEGQAILRELSIPRVPFSTESLTVTKIGGIKKRQIKKSIIEYYEKFCEDLLLIQR